VLSEFIILETPKSASFAFFSLVKRTFLDFLEVFVKVLDFLLTKIQNK
jgi:hypothetical protein